MYAVIQCGSCRRPRVADLTKTSSTCPYCSEKDLHGEVRVLCKCRDQKHARENLAKMTSGGTIVEGFDGNVMSISTRKKSKPAADSWETVEYRYSQAKGLEAKIAVITDDLTAACGGEFTAEDVERLDPKQGRKILEVMLDRCIVHEV